MVVHCVFVVQKGLNHIKTIHYYYYCYYLMICNCVIISNQCDLWSWLIVTFGVDWVLSIENQTIIPVLFVCVFQPIEANDEAFWEQFWSESVTCVQDVFTLIPAAEIRALREESPSNLATLCYKAVEKLVLAAESGCPSQTEQQTGMPFVSLCF